MDFGYTSLFLFLATVFFLLGWLGILPFDGLKKSPKWLTHHGKPVVAKIEQIHKDTSSSGYVESWMILASWLNPDDGRTYRFQSKKISYDPGVYLESGIIEVLIDPTNPKTHYIDVSGLRKTSGH